MTYEQFLESKRHSVQNFGIELKDTYYKQMLLNLEQVESRFAKAKQAELF